MNFRTALSLFLVVFLIVPPAYTACTSPPGDTESFEWDETTKTWTYCDGTNWKNLSELDDSGSGVRQLLQIADDTGACTAAKKGRLRYDNGGSDTWEYCDGSAWGPFEQAGACTAPASCPNVGDVCTNGYQFAGFMLYVTSCEALFVTDDNQSTASKWSSENVDTGAAIRTGLWRTRP